VKGATCKLCGGPRDPALKNRMCRRCYNAYVVSLRKNPFQGALAPTVQAGDLDGRRRAFERVYARHGLTEGTVWERVGRS
jgi:hypothetical protein